VEKERKIESSGTSVEEAIAAGLETLGVERDAVEVEVLDAGNRGLLGFGARPARVRLVVPSKPVAEAGPGPVAAPEPIQRTEVRPEPEAAPSEPPAAPDSSVERELREITPVARQTLEELLEKMGVQARVEDYIKSPQDEDDYFKLVLNVRGPDLGVLIGRRGETLDALQYITRLILGRELERRVNVVVDVEGYRVRREESLRKLALRMAERAMSTGRRQVLEPMSAAERRIVHVTLRDHDAVMTESIGQDENRKVTIFLRGSK
jgi:spoIIIJ-associated protein